MLTVRRLGSWLAAQPADDVPGTERCPQDSADGGNANTQALEMAGVDASEIDLIILCTSTPDDLFGSACTV